jgi:hypothetical protein
VTTSFHNRKNGIHLRHDVNRGLIFGIEFDRIKKLSPGMRPARGMNEIFCGIRMEFSSKARIAS